MRRVLVSLVAWCAMTVGASAQQGAPSAEDLRARAEQMIAAAGAYDLFTPEQNPPAVTMRHRASGLLCRFSFQENGDITIVPSQALGVPRGDDIACGSSPGGSSLTLYATRAAQDVTIDQALAGSVGALRTVFRDARELHPSQLEWVTGLGTPPASRTAAFLVTHEGRALFTRVSVFVANGWVYKMRFTSDTPRGNVIADVFWTTTLIDLAAHVPAVDGEAAP